MQCVERDIGFAQMDSTVFRDLERWFQAELQHIACAASASSSELEEAATLYSLAKLHFDKGTYSAGEQAARRAVELQRRLKGHEHIDTVCSKSLLALLLKRQGKLTEAGELLGDVLDLNRRVLGAEHKNNLASLLQEQRNVDHAHSLFALQS